jgi:hypothetical protein
VKDQIQQDDLNFDTLTPVELPVMVQGKSYILKEASGKAATIYRNALLASMTLGPDGKPTSLRGMASVEPLLVSHCLYTTKSDGNGELKADKLVTQATIESWPSRIQKTLFAKIKEVSMLQEEASERELLGKALSSPVSPLPLSDLKEFVDTLGDDYEALKKWLEPTAEEKAKNLQKDTTAGSP